MFRKISEIIGFDSLQKSLFYVSEHNNYFQICSTAQYLFSPISILNPKMLFTLFHIDYILQIPYFSSEKFVSKREFLTYGTCLLNLEPRTWNSDAAEFHDQAAHFIESLLL